MTPCPKPKKRELRFYILIASLLCFISLLSFIGLPYYRFFYLPDRLQKSYNLVQKGNTEQQVVAIMGKPWKITPSEDSAFWDGTYLGDKGVGTVKVFWYGGGIDGWTVGFDQSGRAVTKYHYSSP